jgi:hypothetical protein
MAKEYSSFVEGQHACGEGAGWLPGAAPPWTGRQPWRGKGLCHRCRSGRAPRGRLYQHSVTPSLIHDAPGILYLLYVSA